MPIGTWKTPNFDFDVNNPDASSVKINIENCFDVAQRIANCFAVHEQASPNMTLRVEAGFIFNTSGTLTEYAAQNTSTITAPTTNPRIDRVVLNPFTGAVSIITGTEAVSPTAPAITAGTRPLARVSLSVGQTTITNTNITDERAFNFFILGTITAPTSAGLLIEAANGTDVGLLGVGNSANVTWYGGHTMTTLTASTSLTTPLILDSNGNEQIQFVTTASAVNHFQITNRGTGLAPIFAAVGDDANININFLTKGTGTYVFNGTSTSQAKISIREQTTNGNNGITLQTAAAVTSDKTWTLPEGDVADGVWMSNGSGVLTTRSPYIAGTSAGILLEASNGTDIGLLGAGNTANVTWYGNHNIVALTATGLITTNGQVAFPAVQNPSANANTLDDYEEGTWTPVPTNLTVVGTPTYTGFYQKIGNRVFCQMDITSTTSTASTAASTYFEGLPFPVNSTNVAVSFFVTTTSTALANGGTTSQRIYSPTWGAAANVVASFHYLT